jgi:hypothetical protein
MKVTGEELLSLLRNAGYNMPEEKKVWMYLSKIGNKHSLRVTWSKEEKGNENV